MKPPKVAGVVDIKNIFHAEIPPKAAENTGLTST
jgi:hypothetical protein